MFDLLLGIAIVFLPIAASLFWLYKLVKRYQHPDRITWQSFAQALSLIILIALIVTAIAITPLAMLLGEKVATKTAVWVFFASLAAAWGLVRRHIHEPPQKLRPAIEPGSELGARPPRQNPAATLRNFPIIDMVIPIAIAVAVSSFFYIHNYNPKLGVLYAAQTGEIYLTDPEQAKSSAPDFSSEGSPVQAASGPASAPAADRFADLVPDNSIKVPYRDILAVSLLLVGISAGLRRGKRSRIESQPY